MSAADQPLVSIVLPVHNGAKFLRESIESCLAQTYRNIELILVDDCSTDATPDIIAEYAARDPRVVAIRNEKNLRLPRSLNAGFLRARGTYFTWTSDDNRYRPHAIQTMAYMLNHRPEVDLVYTDYSVIDNAGATVAHHLALPIEKLVRANCVGASFLYRRGVHERLEGYDVGKPLVEDYDFWLRAARWFHFEPLCLDLYEYRKHDGTLSAKYADDIRAKNRLLLRETLLTGGWLPRSTRARASVALSRLTLSFGSRKQAVDDFWLACRLAPAVVLLECASRTYHYVTRRALSA